MGRIRGFLLKNRVHTLLRRFVRRKCWSTAYFRLSPHQSNRVKPFSRLITWTHHLRARAQAIVSRNHHPGQGYIRVGVERVLRKPDPIPKGHMAIYVGQKDGDFQRILVPVVYINHPLFGDLLKESENEYGFKHPGGITIPCRISEFERVQTRIEAVRGTQKSPAWRSSIRSLMC